MVQRTAGSNGDGAIATESRNGRRARRPPVLRPPSRKPISMLPALVVLALAVVIVVLLVVSGVASHPSGRVSSSPPGPVTVHADGQALTMVPAANLLQPILSAGQPPDDVVRSIAVPTGSTRVSAQRNQTSTDQYDRSVTLRWAGTEGRTIAAFHSALRAKGWRIISQGAPSHGRGVQILAQRAGSDGWYWEIGVTVLPTTFAPGASGSSSSGSPPPASATGSAATSGELTSYRMELVQQSDNL